MPVWNAIEGELSRAARIPVWHARPNPDRLALIEEAQKAEQQKAMGGVYGDAGQTPYRLHAPTPSDNPRALPDYQSRDPNELAMLRMRESVRPQAGRADFPMEHLANMAQVAGGAVLAPEYWIGRGIAAGIQYAPRLAAAVLGGGYAMKPTKAAED